MQIRNTSVNCATFLNIFLYFFLLFVLMKKHIKNGLRLWRNDVFFTVMLIVLVYPEKWSCEHCTYLNSGSSNICEVCSKTRSLESASRGTEQYQQHQQALSTSRNGYSERAHSARPYTPEKVT
jgi:hypothetical protein